MSVSLVPVATAFLGILAWGLAALAGYLAVLALLAWPGRPPAPGRRRRRFDLVIPAHDEALGIGDTLESLRRLDYPAGLRRLVVVADNCSDDTAAVARRHGAMVIERRDPARPGKGQALALAFADLLADGFADALVVIDADTVVTANLLSAFDAHLDGGAQVLQADYGVRNPDAGWRTRLLTLAFTLVHRVRSLGRARLGVSCGLRGNGMCFARSLLLEVPHEAGSIVEDLEQGILLGLAGVKVGYVPEAQVLGEMPASGGAAAGQRRRWEGGRRALTRRYLGPLLSAGIRRRSGVCLDLAADLLIPPLADLAGLVALGIAGTLALAAAGIPAPAALAGLSVATVSLGVYLARGLAVSRLGLAGVLALLAAPAYLAWKLAIGRGRLAREGAPWIRTARERGHR